MASEPSSPNPQQKFLGVIDDGRESFDAAANDVQRQDAQATRDQQLCQTLDSGNFSGWVGDVTEIIAADGMAGLTIDIGDNVEMGTWNNSFSDIGDDTLVSSDSPLYSSISKLSEGDTVKVSGTFSVSAGDCVRESSMTDAGTMNTPDFIVRFTSIQPIASN